MKIKPLGNFYDLHIDSFLRLSELSEYCVEDIITLPNVEGLDEAVCLINHVCSLELKRRKNYARDQFLLEKGKKLIELSTSFKVEEMKKLLEEVYNRGAHDNN